MKRKLVAYICDAPKCTVQEIADDGPPEGYSGTVTHVNARGGASTEWYSCCSEHIVLAVDGALSRAYSGEGD